MSGFEYLRMHEHASMHECEKSAMVGHVLVCVQIVCTYAYGVHARGCVYVCVLHVFLCLCEQVS